MRVPKSVIAMIADLRSHLQENLEPPVYVSDRRLVKAIGMLQASSPTHSVLHFVPCKGQCLDKEPVLIC